MSYIPATIPIDTVLKDSGWTATIDGIRFLQFPGYHTAVSYYAIVWNYCPFHYPYMCRDPYMPTYYNILRLVYSYSIVIFQNNAVTITVSYFNILRQHAVFTDCYGSALCGRNLTTTDSDSIGDYDF